MALTLAEALVGVPNAVIGELANELTKSSHLFSSLPFVTTATQGGLGWVGQYERLTTGTTATSRALNSEGTVSMAKKSAYTTNLKIVNAKFEVDRVLVDASNSMSQFNAQIEQAKIGLTGKVNDLFINGAIATSDAEFDGINALISGTASQTVDAASLDLSTGALITTNANAMIDLLYSLIEQIDGPVSALHMNSTMISKLKSIGLRTTAYTHTVDQFGKSIQAFEGIPLVDLGAISGATTKIIPTTAGKTAIYAVRYGIDGLCAIAPSNPSAALKVYAPDFTQPGAMKYGEIELVMALIMKTSRCVAKLKDVKVA